MDNTKSKSSFKAKIQKLGTNLSSMVMPNIAAIIAWGLITALFMKSGWIPVAKIAELITPMLNYLLPLLIAYCGGRLVYEERGAVVGAIAVMGVIVGADIPMFLGAMIMGPLGGWCMKKFDQLFQEKIRSGFEMIYNNFSAGIIGMLLAILGTYIVNPLVTAGSNFMAKGVDWIISIHMLPLANIFIEPAKILFLNNAIGNGILVPLGVQQAATAGKSVLFLLESNPGPGLGILLAYMFFGKGSSKASAPGAAIIQFFGGIHEIYFPYVLMKPALILAAIAGGVSGTFTFQLLGGGLKAAASPGSIIAILLMTAKGAYFGVIAGVLVAAVVSFVIAAIILKADKSEDDDSFAEKQAQMQEMKAESKGQSVMSAQAAQTSVESYRDVKKIIFACDAGMGSSAMGASLLRDKVKKAGIENISVTNTAVNKLQDEQGLLVITQEELAERAAERTPSAMHVAVDNFLSSPRYDEIVANLKALTQIDSQSATEEQPKNQNSTDNVDNIDVSKVKEVTYVRHDQHVGTATMAVASLQALMHKAQKTTKVTATAIDDIQDDASYLVVATPEAAKNLRLRYTNLQVLVVDNLLTSDQYPALVDKLN